MHKTCPFIVDFLIPVFLFPVKTLRCTAACNGCALLCNVASGVLAASKWLDAFPGMGLIPWKTFPIFDMIAPFQKVFANNPMLGEKTLTIA